MIDSTEQLDKLLEEYDNSLGLSPVRQLDGVDQFLELNVEDIQRYTPEECVEAAAKLAQYAITIQRVINKESCRVKWCSAIIDRICAREWNNYDQYMKANLKVESIARGNDAVNKLIKLRNNAQVKMENLFNISSLIKYYSDVMIEGARTKRRIHER